MPRGRPRIPDQVHQLRGTHRKDRHGDRRSKIGASDKSPTTPRDFDARRKRIWNAVKKELEPLGLWSSTFGMTARLLVDTFDLYLDLEQDVRTNGKVHETPKLTKDGDPVTVADDQGNLRLLIVRKTNPALIERTQTVVLLRGLLSELGLSPSALSRLSVAADGDGVDLLDFLSSTDN